MDRNVLSKCKPPVVAAALLIPAAMACYKLSRSYAAYLFWGYSGVIVVGVLLAAIYLLPGRKRISGRFWFSILITTICLLLLVDWVNPQKAWQALAAANYWLWLLMLVPYLLSYVIRAFRWQYLLEPVKRIGYRNSFDALMIGFWGNSVYPARAGEFIRAYAIAKTERISKSAAFATVVMERIWDGMMVLFFLVLLLIFFPFESPKVHWGGILGLVIYGGALVLVLFIHFFENTVISWLRRYTGWLADEQRARAEEIIISFSRGIEAVRDWRRLFKVGGTTLLIWVLSVVSVYPVLLAFDFQIEFNSRLLLAASTLILVVTALAITVPSAPGGAGPFHMASMIALAAVVPRQMVTEWETFQSVSGSFALVYWLLSVVPVILIGFYCIWSSKLQIAEIRHSSTEPEN